MSSPLHPKGKKRVKADIDPKKAPATAENIRGYVHKYGTRSMSTTAGELNTSSETTARREEAVGPQRKKMKGTGMIIDEEPPASFRKKGQPFTIKPTSKEEGRHQGGVLRSGKARATEMGPSTTLTHGIKDESLEEIAGEEGSGGIQNPEFEENPADAVKRRHKELREKEKRRREKGAGKDKRKRE